MNATLSTPLSVSRLAAGCLTILPALVLATAPAAANGDAGACFRDLERGRGAEIVCSFPIRPNADEIAEMQKQTRGLLKAATCTVSIRIERAAVRAAIDTPDHVFQASPQPVACEITTAGRSADMVVPIKGSFAPRVVIKDGKATDATPGLGNVEGVPRALSYPVEYWVNSGSYVKGHMLQVINAWLDHMRNDVQRRQAAR
jgi:hypothetical protein